MLACAVLYISLSLKGISVIHTGNRGTSAWRGPSESPRPALSYHRRGPNAFQHYLNYQHFPSVIITVKAVFNQSLHLAETSKGPPRSDLSI